MLVVAGGYDSTRWSTSSATRCSSAVRVLSITVMASTYPVGPPVAKQCTTNRAAPATLTGDAIVTRRAGDPVVALARAAGVGRLHIDRGRQRRGTIDPAVPSGTVAVPAERLTPFCEAMIDLSDRLRNRSAGRRRGADHRDLSSIRRVVPPEIADDFNVVLAGLQGKPVATVVPESVPAFTAPRRRSDSARQHRNRPSRIRSTDRWCRREMPASTRDAQQRHPQRTAQRLRQLRLPRQRQQPRPCCDTDRSTTSPRQRRPNRPLQLSDARATRAASASAANSGIA